MLPGGLSPIAIGRVGVGQLWNNSWRENGVDVGPCSSSQTKFGNMLPYISASIVLKIYFIVKFVRYHIRTKHLHVEYITFNLQMQPRMFAS